MLSLDNILSGTIVWTILISGALLLVMFITKIVNIKESSQKKIIIKIARIVFSSGLLGIIFLATLLAISISKEIAFILLAVLLFNIIYFFIHKRFSVKTRVIICLAFYSIVVIGSVMYFFQPKTIAGCGTPGEQLSCTECVCTGIPVIEGYPAVPHCIGWSNCPSFFREKIVYELTDADMAIDRNIDTSDWLEYRGSNFSFKYPSEWKVLHEAGADNPNKIDKYSVGKNYGGLLIDYSNLTNEPLEETYRKSKGAIIKKGNNTTVVYFVNSNPSGIPNKMNIRLQIGAQSFWFDYDFNDPQAEKFKVLIDSFSVE